MTNAPTYQPLGVEGLRELLGDLAPAPDKPTRGRARRGRPAAQPEQSTPDTSWHPNEWRNKRFVTIKELATTLGVNRNTVTQALDKVPEARYTIGRRVLIRKDKLDLVIKP